MSEAKPVRTVRVQVGKEVLVFRASEPIRKGDEVAKVDDQTVSVARSVPGEVLVGRATEHSVPS